MLYHNNSIMIFKYIYYRDISGLSSKACCWHLWDSLPARVRLPPVVRSQEKKGSWPMRASVSDSFRQKLGASLMRYYLQAKHPSAVSSSTAPDPWLVWGYCWPGRGSKPSPKTVKGQSQVSSSKTKNKAVTKLLKKYQAKASQNKRSARKTHRSFSHSFFLGNQLKPDSVGGQNQARKACSTSFKVINHEILPASK